jgi:hypothetical protein
MGRKWIKAETIDHGFLGVPALSCFYWQSARRVARGEQRVDDFSFTPTSCNQLCCSTSNIRGLLNAWSQNTLPLFQPDL